MTIQEHFKLAGEGISKEDFENARKNICALDSIMDDDILENINTYISYKLFTEKCNQLNIGDTSQIILPDSSASVQKLTAECLSLVVQNYVGYAPMCQILSEWIEILDNESAVFDCDDSFNMGNGLPIKSNINQMKKIKIQKMGKSKVNSAVLSENMVEPMAMLIERYFNAESLRKYMDNNRDLLGQGGWQPPPCYWSLMKHPAIVSTIQKLFARNRKSEFLLAFLQDLHNFSKTNPNIDCLPKNIHLSSTSNFSVFTKNVTELLADFLLMDETIETALQGTNLLPLSGAIDNPLYSMDLKCGSSDYYSSNIVQEICSTFSQSENAYFYAQALLHYMIVWRGDYSGCRRLSQMLYHYVRVTLREPRVAQLNLLFTNLTNFPELFKLCKTIFKMDTSAMEERRSATGGLGGFESAVRFPMDQNQVSMLYEMLSRIIDRFESLQMLLYERERTKKIKNSEMDSEQYSSISIKNSNNERCGTSQSEISSSAKEWASLGSLQFPLGDLDLNVHENHYTVENFIQTNCFSKSEDLSTDQLETFQRRVGDRSNDSEINVLNIQKPEPKNSNCDINSYNETIFDMPSVSRMGDIPGTDEIQRLKIGPERPPMDALRESALLDTLIDILVSQNIWLTPDEQSKTIDLLLLLSVYSPYELLLFLEEQKEWDIASKDVNASDSVQDIWSNSEDDFEFHEKKKYNVDTLSDFISSESSSSVDSMSNSNSSLDKDQNLYWLSKKIVNTKNGRNSNSQLSEPSKTESTIGCRSTIDSCIYRNVHTQKILGSLQFLPRNKVRKMKEQFQNLRDLCDGFKGRARKELFRIYNIIHDNLIKDDVRWAYLDHLITTPIGASAVLRYIEVFLFSANGTSPLITLSSSMIVVIKHIAQWHPKKRICIFHLLRLCLEHGLHDQSSNGVCISSSLASTKSEKRRWIIDFFVYLIGGGLYGAVLAYMSKIGIKYIDKTLIRDFTIKLSEFCGPPYSVDFSISYLEFLVNANTIGALDLNAFCDGTLSSSSHKVKLSMIEIVTILDYLEGTTASQGALDGNQ
ncbi:transmembrane domain-containing protein [Cryptosporidium canis]|uniref:Transmembrane domain-containing protein n=1 Tax=Cryptosporidium canis TaxID=195482 RepID=A0ABQ8P662_9CRYT|nr:transmembrane domain-containing protein [Cryptosporidium canis]